MSLFWCRFCLVTSPTTTINRTALLEDNDDALQTMPCHHAQWRMYLFLCLYSCTHTNKQHNADRQTQLSWLWYVEKEMLERRIEKEKERKECNECALCTMSRDERNGNIDRVCDIFDCAQWQSISNSVHIRAVNVCSAWYVVIFYIILSILHTQI